MATTLLYLTQVFQVEFVMRGYLTGSTETSILTQYNNGCRNYCGNPLPEGMVKSQKLPENLLTPTTKGERDIPIDLAGIVREGLMSQADLDVRRPPGCASPFPCSWMPVCACVCALWV